MKAILWATAIWFSSDVLMLVSLEIIKMNDTSYSTIFWPFQAIDACAGVWHFILWSKQEKRRQLCWCMMKTAKWAHCTGCSLCEREKEFKVQNVWGLQDSIQCLLMIMLMSKMLKNTGWKSVPREKNNEISFSTIFNLESSTLRDWVLCSDKATLSSHS